MKKRYHVKKYLSVEEMGTLLNLADLVIARSGANTVTELAALGKPSLLIPLPWNYRQEQLKNALMLKKVGLAEVITQEGKRLSAKVLLERTRQMLKNISQYEKNASAAKKMVRLNAAEEIIRQVESLV